jgi:hypothetical protein
MGTLLQINFLVDPVRTLVTSAPFMIGSGAFVSDTPGRGFTYYFAGQHPIRPDAGEK